MKATFRFPGLFAAVLLLFLASGCIDEPEDRTTCQDPEALNYDPGGDLRDDNLCQYLSQAYSGSYLTFERVTQVDLSSGNSTETIRDYSFTITEFVQPDEVKIVGWNECSDSLLAFCSIGLIDVPAAVSCGPTSIQFSAEDRALEYEVTYTENNIQYTIDGTANLR